ncbi:MAG: APC family permease [Oscillospiraceae bacterium]|nr:APC family permease [Oscillospiraceae bacterium]
MFEKIKSLVIGRPLHNNKLRGEKLNVFWGLPIMASDAISSVAYAVEEMLWVLVAVVGIASYKYMFFAAAAIILLLFILVVSYRQTIDSYPHGGGSYTVAKENLGETPGLTAAASLIIGYVLTVAVSTAAGTAAITSAIPALLRYKVFITLVMILLMTIGNLRGVRESARIFAIPTYIFIGSMLIMIVTGLVRAYLFGYQPAPQFDMPQTASDITFFLLIRAYAAGCSGLTGVEAVSNAVPNFVAPSQKSAKRVLALLALFVFLIFGGTSFMATIYHAVPNNDITVLSQIAGQIFGRNVLYYILQVSTAVILVMAANTSYAGLPMLLSLTARDGYAPKQFNVRGGRLSFSNGIILLGIAAGLLVVLYNGDTHRLVPLYAIGVFLSFTLSQLGMLVKWIRHRDPGRIRKAVINGVGLLLTALTVIIIGVSKMLDGAWIAIVCIIVLVILMKITHAHYKDIARQLTLDPEEVPEETSFIRVNQHMIVLMDSLNKASLKAINYARQLMADEHIVVFNVSIDKEQEKGLRQKWKECNIPLPLVVKYSPYRDILGPLRKYIGSEEHAYKPGDMLTIVMPQFIVNRKWMNIYHSQTAYTIRQRLMHDRHIAVVIVPYVLDNHAPPDDKTDADRPYADGEIPPLPGQIRLRRRRGVSTPEEETGSPGKTVPPAAPPVQ